MKSKQKPNSYSSEFKESAVKLAIESDQPRSVTARELGDVMIHLNGGSDQWSSRPTSVRITVNGIDALYKKMNELSLVKPDERLQDTPLGHRQFSLLDPSDNRITFVQFDS